MAKLRYVVLQNLDGPIKLVQWDFAIQSSAGRTLSLAKVLAAAAKEFPGEFLENLVLTTTEGDECPTITLRKKA